MENNNNIKLQGKFKYILKEQNHNHLAHILSSQSSAFVYPSFVNYLHFKIVWPRGSHKRH